MQAILSGRTQIASTTWRQKMTVRELRALLEHMPDDYEVKVGIFALGDSAAADPSTKTVTINRKETT